MSGKYYPSIEYLRQCVRYENGKLFWLTRPLSHFKSKLSQLRCNKRWSGKEAGNYDKTTDRWAVGIDGNLCLRSRIIWMLHHGVCPSSMMEIDHINRIKSDDRIENLRLATRSQNQGNRSLSRCNKSGIKGVFWDKTKSKWRATITVNGIVLRLGRYEDKQKAAEVYASTARMILGEFTCFD